MLFTKTLGKLLPLEPSGWRFLPGLIAFSCLISPSAVAQIIPDNTLGDESSVVVPDVEIKGIESDRLEGGAVRGNNLFHSFQEFNIDAGRGAYFANPAAIENIFSRVTGVNPSEIFGTLGVLGNANLFLMNPNGIIFGQNASLDLRGSFVGTTADSIVFPDGKEFSATNPGLIPLLTVNVEQPIGLKFEGESGIITNAADLAVASGQTLTLVGGDVSLDEGSLTAPGGRVELGGLSAAGEIGINADSSLSFPDGIARADVTLTKAADVDVQAGGGGFIAVNTRNLELREGSRFLAGIGEGMGSPTTIGGDIKLTATESVTLSGESSLGVSVLVNVVAPKAQGKAGDITIDTSFLFLTDGAFVSAGTFGEGNGGAVTIIAKDAISLSGKDSNELSSGIFNQVNSTAQGKAGDITINTGSLSLIDGALLSANTFGEGNAGMIKITATDVITISGEASPGFPSGIFSQVRKEAKGMSGGITINTGSLYLTEGAFVAANTAGNGNAGAISITANDSITLSGEDSLGDASRIASTVEKGAKGTAGGININARALLLVDGGRLSASTFGKGDAGKIDITTTETVSLSGEGTQFGSDIFSTVEEEAKGTSGGITINTGSLSLADGAGISANTRGEGNAGKIDITATDTISLSRNDSWGFSSVILSQVREEAKGTSGGITINTGSLSLTDGAVVSSGTFGVGDAGDIIINSPQLIIDQGASISAFTQANGNGGTITVNAPQALLLKDNSELNVETSGAGRPGNITITTPNLTIGKDAEISATATATSTNTESGGSIFINASNLDLTGQLGIFAETEGVAPAGTLNLQPDASKPNLDIQFTDTARISASTTASGQGGDINLIAPETINISGQGEVTVRTTGTGNAGSINITTQNLNLSQQTEISASSFGTGLAGDINITVNNFNLTEGATVITNTSSSGQAGDIRLQIRDELNLVDSSITASTDINSIGRGGNININRPNLRPNLTLINSEIEVNSEGKGIGGNITLQADTLTLENQSAITAETVSTDGGEIEINLGDNLVLRDNSQISATAGTAQAGGNGGNVDINAQFILAFPTEDSNITANAFQGNGGEISITAEGILGIEFREQPTILSDITASSEFGLAGTVDIDTPETDPNRGLVTLPQQAVDTQLALGCDVDGEGAVAFYDLGRGGLSTSPDDFLIPDTVIGEWIPLAPSSASFSAPQKLNFELNGQQRATGIKQLVPPCWQ